jgi:hypothetical protein
MTTNDNKTPIIRRASAAPALAGTLLAVVIAGCGAASKSSPSTSGGAAPAPSYGSPAREAAKPPARQSSAPHSEKQIPVAGAKVGGIPQNNGGDQDADNNGGPSDGDGNV